MVEVRIAGRIAGDFCYVVENTYKNITKTLKVD